MISNLKRKQESYIVSDNTPAKDILIKAHNYISENLKLSKTEIRKLVLDLDLGVDNDASQNQKEREECASYICDSIENMRKKLEVKSLQVRHSAHTINISLSLFLRSKRGYDDLRSSGLICLPFPRLLASKISHYKIIPGGDPSIYLMIQDEIAAS